NAQSPLGFPASGGDCRAGSPPPSAQCTQRTESHYDPNTQMTWNSVWYCDNTTGATLWSDTTSTAPGALAAGFMDTGRSWFGCYRRGDMHAGNNDVWYYTQGDRTAPMTEYRQAWGYMPAVNLATTTDPYPGIPECPGPPPVVT